MTTKVDARLNSYSPAVLSLFRIVFALMFTLFGTSHVFDWPIAFRIPTGSWPVWYAGVIELVTGLLILVGLFTRIAAFIASGHMAVTYFWQHQPKGLWPIVPPQMGGNGGLAAILFCFAFFLLVFTGPGAYALDSMRTRRRRQ
ncbi:putative membrane protein [Mycobacterium sp. JS623]|uniref:DoxX family protein n=1 Tax=Mycobacterium sp. JS623 TaxID=212767 RepID=UPI0002A5B5F2|nr:DoxX family protein [Mycobacterium sp. JS623]AGB24189.1 putative membrane protein [Mycobacterium sp. JS623]